MTPRNASSVPGSGASPEPSRWGVGRWGWPNTPEQPWPEDRARSVGRALAPALSGACVPAEEERSEPVTVLVLDARHRLWMPGSQTRARLWLRRQRAVLQPIAPLASRLKGRWGGSGGGAPQRQFPGRESRGDQRTVWSPAAAVRRLGLRPVQPGKERRFLPSMNARASAPIIL